MTFLRISVTSPRRKKELFREVRQCLIRIFLVSFLASTAGAICGIGGGVIIKPTLDLFQIASVSTISFLSGCTVLSMSLYSVGRGLLARDSSVDFKTGTPLALGAAVGGILGKQRFTAVKNAASDPNAVGSVQAGCLAAITIFTLIYTLKKESVRTLQLKRAAPCVVIGIFLGVMSSFLGIGGGPINLVVLRLELGLMPDAVMAMMIPAILPFNLLKGVLNSVIYFVAGRPLSRSMARYQQSGGNRHE